MPVKTHLANAARRRFYYVAATAQPSITPAQFFDAGYTPSTSPRLVNTAQITLHGQQPSNGPNAGPGQQSKGSGGGGQQTTGTLVLPIPGAGEGAPLGGGASGRSTGAEGYGGAAGSLLVPSPGNFSPPSFFPSILGSSERTQGQRSATFRLESGAYGIPKNRPRPQAQATSTPGASTSTAASPSTTPPPPQPPREVLDLSCQIGDDAYFVRSVSTFPFPTVAVTCEPGRSPRLPYSRQSSPQLSIMDIECPRRRGRRRRVGSAPGRQQRLVLQASDASLLP